VSAQQPLRTLLRKRIVGSTFRSRVQTFSAATAWTPTQSTSVACAPSGTRATDLRHRSLSRSAATAWCRGDLAWRTGARLSTRREGSGPFATCRSALSSVPQWLNIPPDDGRSWFWEVMRHTKFVHRRTQLLRASPSPRPRGRVVVRCSVTGPHGPTILSSDLRIDCQQSLKVWFSATSSRSAISNLVQDIRACARVSRTARDHFRSSSFLLLFPGLVADSLEPRRPLFPSGSVLQLGRSYGFQFSPASVATSGLRRLLDLPGQTS